MNERCFSVDEVAEPHVARDAVHRWIDHRGFPARKIGCLWKLKLSEVDQGVRAGDEPVRRKDETGRSR
jgi:hypothetical protein